MRNSTEKFTRRRWLQTAGCGFGSLAFGALAADEGGAPGRPSQFDPSLKFRHAPRAKRVIFLFMDGGPSQFDSFDYKPGIAANDKKKTKGKSLMRSPFEFAPHGESGLHISSAFPQVAKLADDLCLLNAMETDSSSHSSAAQAFFTGSSRLEVPSLGAWSVYGLGDGGSVLPGFISMNYSGSSKNYGHGFLPARYQGVQLEVGDKKRQFFREKKAAAPNLGSQHYSEFGQRRQLDFVQNMNRQFAAELGGDDQVEAVIQSFENGFDMRATLRELLKPENEPDEVQKLYGLDKPETKEFARQCMIARRMVESGVRFIQLNPGSRNSWDHHSSLKSKFGKSAHAIDRPIAGLLIDLKRRGLLDDTLVVWGGEFGRTPHGTDGRDHQNRGFTTWIAGGGIRGGIRHGATDEIGAKIAHGGVHMRDLHATILHQLGFDPEKLRYSRENRDYFSEAKDGRVVREIIA